MSYALAAAATPHPTWPTVYPWEREVDAHFKCIPYETERAVHRGLKLTLEQQRSEINRCVQHRMSERNTWIGVSGLVAAGLGVGAYLVFRKR